MPISFLHPNNTRSSVFRYVYSNTVGLQFNGSEAVATFSIVRNVSDPVNDGAEEQVAVAMTPTTLKAFVYSANSIIETFENNSGTQIPIDPAFVATVEKIVAETAALFKKNRGAK